MITIGSLFTGYGGLDMAVEAVTGGRTIWRSDIDPGACKILAHHWPDVPNLGDITSVDWSTVEPVDIITGGSPCQDLSHAGKRGGMKTGTRSNLWVAMREAIAQLRPSWVVWENVRGAYSAEADSDVEPCPGCVGDGPSVHLRALGRVLGDLASIGYDAAWHGLTAASVGAPHGRYRVFLLAWPAPDADRVGHERAGDTRGRWGGPADSGHDAAHAPGECGKGSGYGCSAWGQFAQAIHRWEICLGRVAPSPTELAPKGGRRLSAHAVEFMMGLPSGWVTDPALRLSRNEQLKALGNGVVPQQAEHALRGLLADVSAVAA